jgi:hypothetical protein
MSSKGSKIVSFTKGVSEEAEAGLYTHEQVAEPGVPQALSTGSFPRKGFEARDARDELVAEKMQMMDPVTGMSRFGQVTATDSDFKWLQKKRESEAYANLDRWIGKNFHKADLPTRKWLQETFPDYYESRERIMVERAKLALRIKLLKLRGAKNEQDLLLQWGLQTGRIKLDEDWDVIGPYKDTGAAVDMDVQRARYKDGLFSFRRYASEDERAGAAALAAGEASAANIAARIPKRGAQGSANPFQTNDNSEAGFQPWGASFPGTEVPHVGRYPAFLANVLQPLLA